MMRDYEVSRVNGVYPIEKIIDQFDRYGIVLLKDYLPAQIKTDLRKAIEQRLANAALHDGILKFPQYPKADFLLGDILAVRALEVADYLFFRRELLSILQAVLNTQELIYWGDSSIQVGEAARGFHKDNVGRYDSSHGDWDGDYSLIRCGFYFQDHVDHSGGLKVRLGSHKIPDYRKGPMADIPSQFGDLAFWSMRITHSGNNRKLCGLSGIPLHPRLEKFAPNWMVKPEQLRRISAFCAFARPGAQAEAYIQNMNRRELDYRPYFQFARSADEAQALLKRFGVTFVKPNDYYGELDRDDV